MIDVRVEGEKRENVVMGFFCVFACVCVGLGRLFAGDVRKVSEMMLFFFYVFLTRHIRFSIN